MADGPEHAPDLPFASLTYRDIDLCWRARIDKADPRRRCHTILELNTCRKRAQRLTGQVPLYRSTVHLLNVEARVKQAVRQISIGREKEETRRVPVEPSHGEQPRRIEWNEIGDGRTALRIVHRRHVPGGLVEHEIRGRRSEGDDTVVNFHGADERIDPGTEL